MPRLKFGGKVGSREIFATWQPKFAFGTDFQNNHELGKVSWNSEYLTDANGLDLMPREVYEDESGPFSASFYPVTSVISMSDFDKIHALTIWNDRSQAGAVHFDGGMKLLIDRRVTTVDDGGIGAGMTLDFKVPLVLGEIHRSQDWCSSFWFSG